MSNQEPQPSFLSNLQNPQHHYDTKKNQLLEDATYIYTYDARGNLKGKVNKTNNHYTYYTFNGLNQLTAVYRVNQDDEIVHYLRYEYDAFNRRVSKEENTVKHYYLYDKENIIAILDKNRQTLATIVHHPTLTDTPLSITNINGTFYFHRDHQGSIIALTDEAGQIVEHITYDNTYGKVLNHFKQEENLTLNPYGYTGREMDAHDLYYYRARYYDPNTQRFLSLDPIGFEAGDFNFYRYVGNDPINFVDPSGLINHRGGHGHNRKGYTPSIASEILNPNMGEEFSKIFNMDTMKDDIKASREQMKNVANTTVDVCKTAYSDYRRVQEYSPWYAKGILRVAMSGTEWGLGKGLMTELDYAYDFTSGFFFDTIPTSVAGWSGYGWHAVTDIPGSK